jgi:putative ABC transport system permease protein
MWTATLRGVLAHKARLALTLVAVTLGVGFVVGTLVLTDGIDEARQVVLAAAAGGSDLAVRPATPGTGGVPVELGDVVAGIAGVDVADVVVTGTAQLVGDDGAPIGQPLVGGSTPMLAASAPAREGMRGLELRDGRFPEAGDEVAVDAAVAGAHGFEVGDEIGVVLDGPLERFRLVGIVGFTGGDAVPGTTLTLFEPAAALERLRHDGLADRIDVLATDRAAAGALGEQVRAAVGDAYEVVTAADVVEREYGSLAEGLSFVPVVLLVFAGVALFVGSFTIFNTFSILVAQRTRELALLRAVGASRRQVLASVLGEAALVGLAGGLAGLVAGLAIAAGLRALLSGFGLEVPGGGLRPGPAAALAGLALGLLVTTASATLPAVRATRVPPVAALSDVAAGSPPGRAGPRYGAGAALSLLGVAAILAGLFAGAGAAAVGAGAVATILGITMLSSLVTGPLAWAVGAPLARLAGVRGELARQNATRSPRRTAATASALMIGLGLVATMAILTYSLRASFDRTLEEVFLVDFRVEPTTLAGDPGVTGISREIAPLLAALDDVAVASPERIAFFDYGGHSDALLALDARDVERIYAFPLVDGDLGGLAGGGVAVGERVATDQGWSVGGVVPADVPGRGRVDLEVVAIIGTDLADVNFLVDNATFERLYERNHDNRVAVVLAAGADHEAAAERLRAALEPYPTARLLDAAGLREELVGAVNALLGLVAALLVLSVVIALLGIVNTLALSILERVRELGLLRAIGATRGQVAAIVRWESMVVAVLGGLLGVALGVLFGWLLVRSLADLGVTEFVVPLGWLAGGLAASAVAGILAGIPPARRASRVDVLRAIGYR